MNLPQGTKYDQDKLRVDLISPEFLWATADVLGYGAKKYEPYNWARGIMYSRVYGAMMRHMLAWWNGEDIDPESRKEHLGHAACCLMFLTYYATYPVDYKEYDDRPKDLEVYNDTASGS